MDHEEVRFGGKGARALLRPWTIKKLGEEICFEDLECFPLGEPWFSLTRPVLPPQGPHILKIKHQIFTRSNPDEPYIITGESYATISGSFYDSKKTTFIVAHGWTGGPEHMLVISDALLGRVDANVILVDFSSMKGNPYLLAVSNIRVVGALTAKLMRYLIEKKGTDPSSFHLIGISLGAHLAAYAAKRVPGVGRLTGLEPAQPLFEGASPEVRIDKNDALFVDIAHTNGRPIVPLGGLGFSTPVGHVDFYFNGGWYQPGCSVNIVVEDMFKCGDFNLLKVWPKHLLCPHKRVLTYFLEALNSNCTFWGVRRQEDSTFLSIVSRGWISEFITSLPDCTLKTCSPFGLDTSKFPARGSFDIITSEFKPFCLNHENVEASMEKQLQEYRSRST